MFLIKLAMWSVLFPAALLGYAIMTILEVIAFLFNSPVDIWRIISNSLDSVQEEA